MKTRVTETIDFSGQGKTAWGVIKEIYTFLYDRDDKAEWKLDEQGGGFGIHGKTSDYRLTKYYQKEA